MQRVAGHKFRVLLLGGVALAAVAVRAQGALAQAPSKAADNGAALSSEAQVHINISRQPLGAALNAFAVQARQHILFKPELVADKTSDGAVGDYTPRAALEKLLFGSGLTFRLQNGTILIVPVSSAEQSSTVSELVVTAHLDQAETSFKADASDTATRSDTPLQDVPQAINVITGAVMQSQQDTTVIQALRNSSGVTANDNTTQGLPSYTIRGEQVEGTLSGGLLDPYISGTPLAGIERIEVLKGPDAILDGEGSFGGVINIVRKKPSADPLANITLDYGSYDQRIAAVDVSGPLTANKDFSARLNVSVEGDGTNFGGYAGGHEYYIAPALRYKTASTDIIFGAELYQTRTPVSPYSMVVDGHVADRPEDPISNRNDGVEVQSQTYYYSVTQEITPWATLVSRGQGVSYQQDLSVGLPLIPSDSMGNTLILGNITNTLTDGFSSDHYLRFNFNIGPLANKLSVGFNTNWSTTSNDETNDFVLTPINLYAPSLVPSSTALQGYFEFNSLSRTLGEYVQDHITWGPFHFLFSDRYDHTFSEAIFSGKKRDPQNAYANSPAAGVVYDINPLVSTFFSYAHGFTPDAAHTYQGGYLPPEVSDNKEIGLKAQLFQRKLSATFSIFDNALSNTSASDPLHPGYEIPQPGQIDKGAEIDLYGQITPNWNIVANYTYLSVAFSSTERTNNYQYIPGEPANKFNLWTTYDVKSGILNGFGGAFGVRADSSNLVENGDFATMTRIPGYVQFDASLNYKWRQWSGILGVKNLLDSRNFGQSITALYIPILEPRTVLLTLKRSFF